MLLNHYDFLYDMLFYDFLKSPKSNKTKQLYINLKQTSKHENIEKILTFFIKIYDYKDRQVFCKHTAEDIILVIVLNDQLFDRHIFFKREHGDSFDKIKAGYIINFDIVYMYEFSVEETKSYLKFILM